MLQRLLAGGAGASGPCQGPIRGPAPEAMSSHETAQGPGPWQRADRQTLRLPLRDPPPRQPLLTNPYTSQQGPLSSQQGPLHQSAWAPKQSAGALSPHRGGASL